MRMNTPHKNPFTLSHPFGYSERIRETICVKTTINLYNNQIRNRWHLHKKTLINHAVKKNLTMAIALFAHKMLRGSKKTPLFINQKGRSDNHRGTISLPNKQRHWCF